ncbi:MULTISPECIES: hypothetical protein [unclassified Streptomyces]|uniref:hypothetical protein n=1 Tax=unclassified Streptomyces TaxID=2593676 RepID=UPI0034048A4B
MALPQHLRQGHSLTARVLHGGAPADGENLLLLDRVDDTTAANVLNHALTRAQNPAARRLFQLRLARALAAQGDRIERRAVLRALAAAEKHLGDAGADRPAWCAWVSEADLAVDSGQALLDLGDIGRAHRLLTEGEDLLPPARDETRGVFLAYRAASYLDLKEPEPVAAAAESLLLARRLGAPRCSRKGRIRYR